MIIRNSPKLAGFILLFLSIIIVTSVFIFIPPIAQWHAYHQFSDIRALWNLPNFANVFSNLAFLLVSILGFLSLYQQAKNKNITRQEAIIFFVLFLGILLTSIGSAYYHWSPDNNTLVWDRLPITIVFMAFLALTIMGRINFNLGFWLLIPLLLLGIFSVLYWHWTELIGQGDLRLYGLVQFYTLFLIALILCFFPKDYPPLTAYIWVFVFYGLAKICEYFDITIYQLDHRLISGHTLKHIFSAVSLYGAVMILGSKTRKIPIKA